MIFTQEVFMSVCFYLVFVVAVQLLSCIWLFATPWAAACQAPQSFTVSWSLLKFMSTEWMMPPNHLMLCCPLLLPSISPSIRVFSDESVLPIRWPEYWSFNSSINLSNEYSGLSSFRWTGWIWNSSTGIPSPLLALFVVMLPKARLTSQSRMSGSRWVVRPLWLSGL